ncbi:MAG: hypothetical protein LBN38_07925 [Verrucomicrobiota bacterium]|jgi:hypothetical protein|nr:hypothetical protein [Verrucomicrobiota bacterium]
MILAYIDPGSGSILFQVLLASVVGGIAVFWTRIKAFFTGRKAKPTSSDHTDAPADDSTKSD